MRHNRLSGRSGQQIAPQADDASRRNLENDSLPVVNGLHIDHRTFSFGHQLDHTSGVLFRNIYRQLFDRFAFLAVNLLDNYLGLTDLKLIPFTPHRFDQNGEMQNAPSINDKAVR